MLIGFELGGGFSEESLSPDFDGFALAHSVDKPFPAGFVMDTAGS